MCDENKLYRVDIKSVVCVIADDEIEAREIALHHSGEYNVDEDDVERTVVIESEEDVPENWWRAVPYENEHDNHNVENLSICEILEQRRKKLESINVTELRRTLQGLLKSLDDKKCKKSSAFLRQINELRKAIK
jgi:hypothetical protein